MKTSVTSVTGSAIASKTHAQRERERQGERQTDRQTERQTWGPVTTVNKLG